MTDIWGDRAGTARAHERFLAGESAVGGLRPGILNSWRRCHSLALDPDLLQPPYRSDPDLEGRLARAAGPVLERLEAEVAGSRVGVLLADCRGVILRCDAGETALYRHLDAVRLAPGFQYDEQHAGTNGIGTALEERTDFHVFGAEHYARALEPFASFGAPVRDPLSGRIEGVVALVCWCSDAEQKMRSTARAAADAVEQRLLEQHTQHERALFQEFLQVSGSSGAPAQTLEQGLLCAEEGTLSDHDRLVLREKAAELISTARAAAMHVPLSGGRLATLVCEPVSSPTGECGVVVKVGLPEAAPRLDGAAELPRTPSPEGAAAETRGGGPGATGAGATGAGADAAAEWLLSVGAPGVGRLAVAARERLGLLYDAGLRIGTSLDVTRTAEDLVELVVPRFADFVTVDLLEPVLSGDEPVTAHAPLRRAAVGAGTADSPFHPVSVAISYASSSPQARAFAEDRSVLEADLGALSDWRAQDPTHVERLLQHGIHSLISIALHPRDTTLGLVSFYRSGHSERFEEDDLHLAEELVTRLAVCVDNARRYTREHTTALTLQHSLLPRTLPEQNAVDVAHRYLPARASEGGVGGDWFDVIPLSGARVALVIGDVVGHGLRAAVTMGRLRTAVHNFAALDLSPDELLARLDDLVISLDQTENAPLDAADVTGATCLYAVYDPTSQNCTLARAGHPPPAVVDPGGLVHFPDLPPGPPLGLGGLPFETAELHLPEGSQLVLFTDGLVEDRHRDIDTSLDQLARALTHPGRPPELTCDAVLDALPVLHAGDDVTLLVARTRAMDPADIADWDVPDDPAAVSRVRAAALDQLADWGLEETAFATELMLSELVTNALRHASPPIRVRLLRDRDRALVCEVSDGSSTSPHLRRAADTDEGGRGLFLIAQIAARWGTRYTPHGKVIWAEQPL